jgi:hypothetical protein
MNLTEAKRYITERHKLRSALETLGRKYVFHPDNRVKKLSRPRENGRV